MKIGQKLFLSTPTALGHDPESTKSVILNERLTKDVLAANYGHLFVSSVPTSCTLRRVSMVFVWHLCDWCGSRISFRNLFSAVVFRSMPRTKNWSWIFRRNVPMGPDDRIDGFHTSRESGERGNSFRTSSKPRRTLYQAIPSTRRDCSPILRLWMSLDGSLLTNQVQFSTPTSHDSCQPSYIFSTNTSTTSMPDTFIHLFTFVSMLHRNYGAFSILLRIDLTQLMGISISTMIKPSMVCFLIANHGDAIIQIQLNYSSMFQPQEPFHGYNFWLVINNFGYSNNYYLCKTTLPSLFQTLIRVSNYAFLSYLFPPLIQHYFQNTAYAHLTYLCLSLTMFHIFCSLTFGLNHFFFIMKYISIYLSFC